MKKIPFLLFLVLLSPDSMVSVAQADNLLIDRVRATEARKGLPRRGQTTTQVERDFGAPREKLEPRGGQKSQWPVINRWVYPGYTVYFERNRVIDVVLSGGASTASSSGAASEAQWWDDEQQPPAEASSENDLSSPLPLLSTDPPPFSAEADDWEAYPIQEGEENVTFPVIDISE